MAVSRKYEKMSNVKYSTTAIEYVWNINTKLAACSGAYLYSVEMDRLELVKLAYICYKLIT